MARPPYALILLGALVLGRSALGQSSLAPQTGVLVLRNGQALDGEVTRAGDYYIVGKGQGSELRLKADDVELFCGSLVEAYEFKAAHLSGISGRPHIELAKWCLRHGLFAQCSDQLAAAADREPDNPQIKDLQTRLALVAQSPAPPVAAQATAATISAEDLEMAVRVLPKASVEKFGAIVQPILLNRCGANLCHGPNAKSEFRLLRPPPGQIVSRRFTQRNLYAAVKYLDRTNPELSPLIAMPQQRHGNSLNPVFDKHSAGQLDELVAWARMTLAPISGPKGPASIAAVETTLSQPASASQSTEDKTSSQAITAVGVRAMRPPLDQPPNLPTAASPRPSAPRDRFDPEIFNQRYHAR